MNFAAVFGFLGRLLQLVALAQLAPLACALWYGETRAGGSFLTSIVVCGAAGSTLAWFFRHRGRLYRREGILIVVGGWILCSLFGALPFLLSHSISSPTDALFESASGFTTTGASILSDIESLDRSILFWRSLTQWLGGLGIVVLFVALLSGVGPGARFLYSVEVPGPAAEVMHPRVRDTAKALLRIYVVLTGLCITLLLFAGLDPYTATTHAFATLSTGGFSPLNASAAGFTPAVQGILVVFMLLAGINFSLLLLVRRNLAAVLGDGELRTYCVIVISATAWIVFDLSLSGESSVVLPALFQVASILTTTGFASADFNAWPGGSRAVLVLLMLIGGCAGSTAGGLKIMRLLVLWKVALREVRVLFSPNLIVPIMVRSKLVAGDIVRSVSGFLVLYVFLAFAAALALTLSGRDLITAFTAAVACLGNIGPGLEGVGPAANFAAFAAWEKLLLVALMWLGRLEILAMAALLVPSFWRR